jgi:hypothetical protein
MQKRRQLKEMGQLKKQECMQIIKNQVFFLSCRGEEARKDQSLFYDI